MESIREVGGDGIIRWFDKDGLMHRLDGPALLRPDGSEYWYYRGYYHRDDGGPAILDYMLKFRQWRIMGKIHRVGKPAVIEFNGTEWWFINGLQHREDGPALYNPRTKEVQWCYKYKRMKFEDWCHITGKTKEEIVQLKLTY